LPQHAFVPAPTVAPPLPSQQPPVLPQTAATSMDFYHQSAQQQQPIRYPQQYSQYPGYPPQPTPTQPQQRYQPQQSSNSSPFRATTPSPFVPRNSAINSPQQQQQQQQQQQHNQTTQSVYRGSNSAAQYSAPQSQQQQQSQHQMPNQNYQTGDILLQISMEIEENFFMEILINLRTRSYSPSVISGYGSPAAFYYPGAMGGAGGFPGGAGAAAMMYGSPGGGGAMPYPLHLSQGGQWDSLMYGGMMAAGMQPHANRAQTEEFQRMAAANRAAVRSTATSPDLRPSSSNNHLTGVITGAMQALNNFQIPSPPLGGTSFGGYPNTGSNLKHSASISPAPAMIHQSRDTHRPSSTHSNSSTGKTSRTPEPSAIRTSPNLSQSGQYSLLPGQTVTLN
jgi:hypothetical protein